MLEVTFAGWAATIGLIAVLFVIDLFVSRPGHAHAVGFREPPSSSSGTATRTRTSRTMRSSGSRGG